MYISYSGFHNEISFLENAVSGKLCTHIHMGYFIAR